MHIRETDLYQPVAEYLKRLGYTVRSEVCDCDITAVKGDELVIVELKKSFSIDLLIQATSRQRTADAVYVAIPRPAKGLRGKHWRGVAHLARRLELGLILVSPGSSTNVEVAIDPSTYVPKRNRSSRRAILKEIEGRSQDCNLGGSSRKKIMTAYRESAIQIACYLDSLGPQSPKQLRTMGTGPKTWTILYRNVYKWFVRVSKGVYGLSAQGVRDLGLHPELTTYYKRTLGESASTTECIQ